jgi:sigma-54 dependent transcriptional regulator, acetoin dehydrogenase operon transcriptional activator AcoR
LGKLISLRGVKVNIQEANWHKFVIKGEDNINVRKPILDSWNRSRRLGVTQLEKRILPLVEKNDWEDRVYKNRLLIKAARPVIEDMYKRLKGGGYQVVLADAEGYIMEFMADQKAEIASSKIGLSLGVKWLEKYVGSTGLTITLETHSPMVTLGAENYWNKLWGWDCAAAPIFVENEFAGVLNICRLTTGEGMKEFLSLAFSGANAVGLRMQVETMKIKEKTLTDLLSLTESVSDSTGILALNSERKLIYKNSSAQNFLNVLQNDKNYFDSNFIMNILESNPQQATNAASHIIFEESSKEYVLESIEYKSGDDVTSKVLLIHSRNPIKKKFFTQETSAILSAFPTKDIDFKNTLTKTSKVAKSDMCVLIQGESGTGKDFMARAIHMDSGRKKAPFIAINCAALPRELIISELFGYSSGAFTGANKNGNPGKIEAANGGTLFLDEIGDMPLDLQAVLLRTLEEKQVARIGSVTPVPVDVRFIVASHKNLQELVRQGKFREDLYYRLSIFKIKLPSLRERKSDLENLIQIIAHPICEKLDRPLFSLTNDALSILQIQPWNGNLRELRNMVERIAYLHDEDVVDSIHLADYIEFSSDCIQLAQHDNEKELIQTALQRTSGNRAMAARELGISRTAFYRKLDKYGL